MPKQFDILQLAEEEAITVKLRDGKILRARDLTPDVVDALGQIEDKRAKEGAKDEAMQRQHLRVLRDANATDEAYTAANEGIVELVSKAAQRSRTLNYEQLTRVFIGDDDKPLSLKFLQEQIPLPVAHRIGDELTRQILGRQDAEGNAAGSNGGPTPTGSTS